MDHNVMSDREEGLGRRIEWRVYPPYYEGSKDGVVSIVHLTVLPFWIALAWD